ncbi:MAG: tetratricopeptide repeat protein [Pseudomonadota bacterium]
MKSAALLMAMMSLVIVGCATPIAKTPAPVENRAPKPVAPPPPKEDDGVIVRPLPRSNPNAAPPSAPPSGTPAPRPRTAPANPAVVALANQATQAEAQGDHARAAAALERALNVAPDDPQLWHRLARVRLAEAQWVQAEALAAKSNRLASDDRDLRRRNLGLIAEARRARGDRAGAAAASREANLLR